MSASEIRSRRIVFSLFIVSYVLLGAIVVLAFIQSPNFGINPRMTIEDMIDGTAFRPFVYRLLIPKLAGLLVYLTPSSIEINMNAFLQSSQWVWQILHLNPATARLIFSQPTILYTRFVIVLIVSLCIAGYVCVQYRLGKVLFPQSWAVALFAPIVGLLIIPACTLPSLMMYDPGVLFLSAMCYYCLAKEQWKRYCFWLFIASLNKETAIYIVLFYGLYFYPRLPRKQYFTYLIAQVLICGYTKLVIDIYYVNNPGFILENHSLQHLFNFLHPRYTVEDIFILLASFYLLVARWQQKPLFARYILFVSVALYTTYCWYGNIGEYRVFFDVLPLITLLISDSIMVGSGLSVCPIFTNKKADHNA